MQLARTDSRLPPPKEGAGDPANFVGSDTCMTCHADVVKKFATNPNSASLDAWWKASDLRAAMRGAHPSFERSDHGKVDRQHQYALPAVLFRGTHICGFPHVVSPTGSAHNQAARYVVCTNCRTQMRESNANLQFFKRGESMTLICLYWVPDELFPRMARWGIACGAGLALFLLSGTSAAERDPTGTIKDGNAIHRSIDLSGHIADYSGRGAMYDPLVNIQRSTSPEPFLDMHAFGKTKYSFFDTLTTNSSDHGGHPNNFTMVRHIEGAVPAELTATVKAKVLGHSILYGRLLSEPIWSLLGDHPRITVNVCSHKVRDLHPLSHI
jgi:hypothetical protein